METAVPSPSGKLWYLLVPAGERDLRLEIGGAGEDAAYRSALTWADWFPVDAAWDDSERVWVASADVGVNVFARDGDGWRRYAWEPGAAGRAPMEDVSTGEWVAWIDAEPPAGLRTGVRGGG
jgi:hypothetical protein